MFRTCCWRISAFVLLFLASCASEGCDPPSLQEGHQGTLVCSAPITTRQLTWQLEKNGALINISSCVVQGNCNNYLQGFSASNQSSSNGTIYQSVLTIASANRNESIFKCVADRGLGEIICKIEVYVKPESPTCSSPVEYSSNQIAVSCNTSRVYPEAACLFSYFSQNFPQPIDARVEYNTFPSPTSPGDNATVCTFIMGVSGFKPGNYQLTLKMFPKITKIPSLAIVTLNTGPIILRAPNVTLGKDCPNGPSINASYIDARFGEETSCRCELADEGFPRGQSVWYNNNGSVSGITNTRDGSSNMTLKYNSNDPNPSYECRASTALNSTTATVIYQPLYAVGPNTVSITVDNQVFDLCPSAKNITISCSVLRYLVTPQPTFSIFINSQNRVIRQTAQLTSTEYTYSYTFRPESGGDLQVICRAENSAFSDVQAQSHSTLQIREPPMSAPKISVFSRGTDIYQTNVYVQNGDSISVICVVDGGTPLVQSVILKCGNKQTENYGNRATLVLAASTSLTGQMCHCQASHVTNCYNQDSEILLHIQVINEGTNKETDDNLGIKVGLSVGLGTLAVAFVVILVIVLRRHRSRGTSQPPTYVSDWVNNKPLDHDTSFSASRSGQALYVTPSPHVPQVLPYTEIYDEIPQPPDYYPNRNFAPPGHRNVRSMDYIQPLP